MLNFAIPTVKESNEKFAADIINELKLGTKLTIIITLKDKTPAYYSALTKEETLLLLKHTIKCIEDEKT